MSKALRLLQITAKHQDFPFFYCISNYKNFIPKYPDNALTDSDLTSRTSRRLLEEKAPKNDFIVRNNAESIIGIILFSKIQLVVYYQCCVLIGRATTRLCVIAHQLRKAPPLKSKTVVAESHFPSLSCFISIFFTN